MLKFVSRIPLATLIVISMALVLAGCNLRSVNAPTDTPYPTPNIPQVRFVFPENRSSVLEGTDLAVELLAEDPGVGIAKVQLLVDDSPQGEGKPEIAPSVPAFSAKIHWVAKGIGLHSLTALAFRADGTSSAPATLLLLVIVRPTAAPS
ncbi:MAG: Ig-like domain-containing protein [Chloroflexota bacterium]